MPLDSKSERAEPKDGFMIRVMLVGNNEAFRCVASDFLQRQYELTIVGAIGGKEARPRLKTWGHK